MRARLALVVLVALGGCGLQPVYSGGAHGAAATALADIEVAPIPDRAGFLVREALRGRFGEAGGAPRYRLEVQLSDEILGFGLRGDNSIARERRTLRARYRLIQITTGAVVIDDAAAADEGVNRVSSDYAVLAAETTALERLSTDLARQIGTRIAVAAHAGKLGPQ